MMSTFPDKSAPQMLKESRACAYQMIKIWYRLSKSKQVIFWHVYLKVNSLDSLSATIEEETLLPIHINLKICDLNQTEASASFWSSTCRSKPSTISRFAILLEKINYNSLSISINLKKKYQLTFLFIDSPVPMPNVTNLVWLLLPTTS